MGIESPKNQNERPHKHIPDEATPTPDEVRVDEEGNKWVWKDTGYTIREYYSHSTLEKGPGPGWDSRLQLLNDEYSQRNFGRTFTEEEVFNPGKLPNEPYYQWDIFE